jgi:Ca2+-dependent lipid-binding protein
VSLNGKRWLTKVAQSVAIVAAVWVIAWFIGGSNIAFAAVVIVILIGIIGAFLT